MVLALVPAILCLWEAHAFVCEDLQLIVRIEVAAVLSAIGAAELLFAMQAIVGQQDIDLVQTDILTHVVKRAIAILALGRQIGKSRVYIRVLPRLDLTQGKVE